MRIISRSALSDPPLLVASLLFVTFVVAVVGSLGAPLITSVSVQFHVSLSSAQWTLTIPLLTGAIATPLLGRLGAGPHRRGAVLATLLVIAGGSLLTALPLSFAWLIIGRGIQGVGLGLPALMMGVARDHVSPSRAPSTISLISVASTISVGIGYPVAGLITQLGGVRAAYSAGVIVSLAAFVVAVVTVPKPPQERSSTLDIKGAVLLAFGIFPILLVASETSLWARHLVLSLGLVVSALFLLGFWWKFEHDRKTPLVDVKLLRLRAVFGANLAMLVGGVGMYLLLTLLTRYSQTPETAGYGFGLSTFVAGLVLVPFSFTGFAAGKAIPYMQKRMHAFLLLVASAMVVLAAFALFAFGRTSLVVLLLAMGVLGFGVGAFSAAMPVAILAVTPKSETSSAMGFTLVVRSIGFSLGSAIGGLTLSAGTAPGHIFPSSGAYSTASLIGGLAMLLTAGASFAVGRDGNV